jgi:hypothetical protein
MLCPEEKYIVTGASLTLLDGFSLTIGWSGRRANDFAPQRSSRKKKNQIHHNSEPMQYIDNEILPTVPEALLARCWCTGPFLLIICRFGDVPAVG